jgi:beta propeller repeat protein
MQTIRSGLGNILGLGLLVGLTVLAIAMFSNARSGSLAANSSPVATPAVAGVPASPLATPNVPLAHIGAPVLLQASGQLGTLNQTADKFVSTANEAGTVLFDPTNGVTRTIGAAGLVNAHVSDHWLVYEDHSPLDSPVYYSRIKIVDLNTGKEILLGDQNANQQDPQVSGNFVVWDEPRNGQLSSIYAYDLSAGKEFPVIVKPGVRGYPRISGQWIIYIQWPGENPTGWESPVELRIHSLATGEDSLVGLMPMTKDASALSRYAIDGDKFAWVKHVADGQDELHLYDLTTRIDRKLLDGGASDLSISAKNGILVVSGRRVLDWFQPTPTIISVTPPVKPQWGYELSVVGDYLVWQIPLTLDYSDGQIFVTRIVR